MVAAGLGAVLLNYSTQSKPNPYAEETMTWDQRKQKVLERITKERSVFINPRKHVLDWHAALELVGKGIIAFDGARFSVKA